MEPYTVTVKGTATADSTAIRRAASHPDGLLTNRSIGAAVPSTWGVFQNGLQQSQNGHCLGTRRVLRDGRLGPYVWRTYSQVEKVAIDFGRGLLAYDCVPKQTFPDAGSECHDLRLLGLFSINRQEWTISDLACCAFGITSVPFYDTLGRDAMEYIVAQTRVTTIAASADCAKIILNSSSLKIFEHLKTIICFDEITNEMRQYGQKAHVRLLSWMDLIVKGRSMTTPTPGISTLDHVYTLCYTSGTTGPPKGVVSTHRCIVSTVCAAFEGPFQTASIELGNYETHISYLPLAHVYERILIMLVYFAGGRIGFYSGDILKLFDDIKELKPTFVSTVPRLLNRVNDTITSTISQKPKLSQRLFNKIVKDKITSYRDAAQVNHWLYDSTILRGPTNLFGGRARFVISGSAPLDNTTQERVACITGTSIVEGYGMTETTGASFVSFPNDPTIGHVGGPFPCLEYKLQSVPEMKCFATDHPPRGELCVRGPALFSGYFRRPDETNAVIDSAGWFHTGDVCEIQQYGGLKIIDRKKDIFKLAQGEYIAPAKIENILQQSEYISQIFVTGLSTKAFLVTLVVPDKDVALRWSEEANGGRQNDFVHTCQNAIFKKKIENEIQRLVEEFGLQGFERPKKVTLITEPFTVENGLLTPTFKLKRSEAFRVFHRTIMQMYEEADNPKARM